MLSSTLPALHVGDLVYPIDDQIKARSRDHYLVVDVAGQYVYEQNFVGNTLRSRRYSVRRSDRFLTSPSPPCAKDDRSSSDKSSSLDQVHHPADSPSIIPPDVHEPRPPLIPPLTAEHDGSRLSPRL